jgi:hypothetical protein
MWLCQTTILFLVTNIFIWMLNGRERKEAWKKKLGVTLRSMNNEMHLFLVDNQYHLQIIEIHAKLQLLSRLTHDTKYMFYTKFVLHVMLEE